MRRSVLAALVALPALVLLVPAAAATGALWLFASCARAIGRMLEPDHVSWMSLMMFDPVLGWRARPTLDAHYFAEHDDVFRIVTDAEGWPGRRPLDDSDIVVIGDSFAFGYGIDTDRSFAAVRPDLKVKALGAPGYSMVQGVLLMEQLAARLEGKLVVWFVYVENDLQDNLMPNMRTYPTPFVRQGDGAWEIVRHHVRPVKWSCSRADLEKWPIFAQLCTPGPIADRAYSACDYLIERGMALCRGAGAHLVVMSIPHPLQLTDAGVRRLAALSRRPGELDEDMPDRRIREICRRHRVPLLAAKTFLSARDYKSREGIHWNARGHRRVAGMLAHLYGSFTTGSLDEALPAKGMGPEPQAVPEVSDAVTA